MGLPLYFGLPSVIFRVPSTNLQIQHFAIYDIGKNHTNKNW